MVSPSGRSPMASSSHKVSIVLLLLLCTIALLPESHGRIAEYDEYLLEKERQAYKETEEAFEPNPVKVADDLNEQVGEILMNKNITRRHLGENGCKATNPIDQCWRCDPNWGNNRKRLAECASGFGHRAIGGKKGRFYVVTDPSDNDLVNPKPGTLRHAVIQTEPLWITFARSMIITLQQELIFASDKTIDGRGVVVRIAYGSGFTIQYVHNIIIHNIWIHNIVSKSGGMIRDSVDHFGRRTRSDGDGITVFGSNNIWIDHVSLSKASDGLIDVIHGSTAVTISNCKFNHHNRVMLLGAHDTENQDKLMQVTVAFNRFGKGSIQRMPRCRRGFFHVINNFYSQWEMYAIGGSANPTIVSQGNRFKASNSTRTKQVTKRENSNEDEWKNWQWRSEGDRFVNGAFFVESGPQLKHTEKVLTTENSIKFQHGDYAGTITRSSGALRCTVRKMC